MPEMTRLAIVFCVPVVRKFHLGARSAGFLAFFDQFFVYRSGEENQGIAVLLVHPAAGFFQAKLVAIKIERRIEIADAEHSVQISHRLNLTD
jgi:hypothetical protein